MGVFPNTRAPQNANEIPAVTKKNSTIINMVGASSTIAVTSINLSPQRKYSIAPTPIGSIARGLDGEATGRNSIGEAIIEMPDMVGGLPKPSSGFDLKNLRRASDATHAFAAQRIRLFSDLNNNQTSSNTPAQAWQHETKEKGGMATKKITEDFTSLEDEILGLRPPAKN